MWTVCIYPNEKGVALITSLLFLGILSLCWLTLSWVTGQEANVVQNRIESERSALLAETGVQQALWRLSQDYDWMNWGATLPSSSWTGSHGRDSEGDYYEWGGNSGDPSSAYSVRIRNHGLVNSKIIATGTNADSRQTIEEEIGSAFDCGLFSCTRSEFEAGSFTIRGSGQTGYAYARDGFTDPAGLLSADKICGGVPGEQVNYYYLPQGSLLPELWKTKDPRTSTMVGMEAYINGPPSATTVSYDNDSGEDHLETGALLHNKAKGTFRKILSFDVATNTITTETSTDAWEAHDEISVERIRPYEDYWQMLAGNVEEINNPSQYGTPDTRNVIYPDPYSPAQEFSNVCFNYTPTVQFGGATTFSGMVQVQGNAIFGRLHTILDVHGSPVGYSGETTISGEIVVNGNAYFLNRVTVTDTGRLYVVGSVYMWDMSSYNWTCYGCDLGGTDISINESSSGSHGITISSATGLRGGLLVRNGSLHIYKAVADEELSIAGYCYVNQDAEIIYGTTSWQGKANITGRNTTEGAFYVRNGSLEVGSGVNNILSDLEGKGRVIVARNITITHSLLAPDSNNPLFIAAGGDFLVGGGIGSPGSPFSGMVYAGENASIATTVNIGGGLILANHFLTPLKGGSVVHRNFRMELYNLGFNNHKDFSRPLLWREAG